MLHEASENNRTLTRRGKETDGSISAVETEEQEHIVRVTTATTLQPVFETPVLDNTNASGIVQIDLGRPFEQQYP